MGEAQENGQLWGEIFKSNGRDLGVQTEESEAVPLKTIVAYIGR
jgi:hypothetical protein